MEAPERLGVRLLTRRLFNRRPMIRRLSRRGLVTPGLFVLVHEPRLLERFVQASHGRNGGMRALAIGIGIAVVVLVLSGGHVFFLPLLLLPFGLFSFGHRRNRRR
jgi:hypothetical protein